MLRSKYVTNTKMTVAGLMLTVFIFSGCGESSDSKAAKEIRKSAAEATELYGRTGDFDEAHKIIQKALGTYAGKASTKADPGYLAAGNIALTHAQRLQLSLSDMTAPASGKVVFISDGVIQLAYLQAKQTTFDSLLKVTDNEVAQLQNVIGRQGQTRGLTGQLSAVNARIAQLTSDKNALEAKYEQAKTAENDLQKQAEEKLKLAEKATGTEKVQLQKQGYDLLLSKTPYYITSQQASDRIDLLENEIAVAAKLSENMRAEIDDLSTRLSEMSSTARIDALKSELKTVTDQISLQEEKLLAIAGDLEILLNSYYDKVEEIAGLFQMATDSYYKKIRGRGAVSELSDIQTAESYLGLASLCAGDIRFQSHLSARLQSLAAVAQGRTESALGIIVSKSLQQITSGKDKALESYAAAIDGYGKARKSIRSKDKDVPCSLAKSQALAMYSKMGLEDFLGDYVIAEQTEAAANELMIEIAECDPDFTNSVTQRLFAGDLQYTPAMPIMELAASTTKDVPTGGELPDGTDDIDYDDPNSF